LAACLAPERGGGYSRGRLLEKRKKLKRDMDRLSSRVCRTALKGITRLTARPPVRQILHHTGSRRMLTVEKWRPLRADAGCLKDDYVGVEHCSSRFFFSPQTKELPPRPGLLASPEFQLSPRVDSTVASGHRGKASVNSPDPPKGRTRAGEVLDRPHRNPARASLSRSSGAMARNPSCDQIPPTAHQRTTGHHRREAGRRKTAIVEGTRHDRRGDVPLHKLKDQRVLALDIGALVARLKVPR